MSLEHLFLSAEDAAFKNCLIKLQNISKAISTLKEQSTDFNKKSLKASFYKDLYECIEDLWSLEYFEFMYITNIVINFKK
jgi:hypothetical protein